jgi:NTP pyrophosphatase (non-canonical NTP hydrolase)
LDQLKKHLDEVVNKTWNFAGRLGTYRDHQQNAIIGLAAEAGEALDVCKKMWFHTAKDRSKELRSELGDVIYYWLKSVEVSGFTIEEVLADNRAKLESRHPELGVVKERFGPEFVKYEQRVGDETI